MVGTKRQITKVKNRVLAEKKENVRLFSFDRIIECPTELREVTSGSEESIYLALFSEVPDSNTTPNNQKVYEVCLDLFGKNYSKEHIAAFSNEIYAQENEDKESLRKRVIEKELLANKYNQNMKSYGYTSWYDWCVDNWGTKWDATNVNVTDTNVETKKGKSLKKVCISYDTAWAPAIPVVRKLAELFPKCLVKLRYFECGAAFQGILKLKGKEELQNWEGHYSGGLGG